MKCVTSNFHEFILNRPNELPLRFRVLDGNDDDDEEEDTMAYKCVLERINVPQFTVKFKLFLKLFDIFYVFASRSQIANFPYTTR